MNLVVAKSLSTSKDLFPMLTTGGASGMEDSWQLILLALRSEEEGGLGGMRAIDEFWLCLMLGAAPAGLVFSDPD